MKKSIRILSVLMALAMLIGTFTVMGSAYQAYKGNGITQWNDIDKPVFNTEQYATMAVDELDRMLAEEQIYLTEDDLFGIGELDLRSVNALFKSLGSLLDSADQLLPLLGDAADLSIDSLYYDKGSKTMIKVSTANDSTGNVTDLEVFTRLIGFLYDNKGILTKYVNHTFNLNILDGVIADYKYSARDVVFGLLKSITDDSVEWDKYVCSSSDNLDSLLQELVIYAMIGVYDDNGSSITLRTEADGDYVHEGIIWDFVKDVPYAALKDIINNVLNITNTTDNAYTYIEQLLVAAFNYVAVPELNKVTGPWLREEAGIIYDKAKVDNPDYPNYNGEPWKDAQGNPYDYIDTAFAAIFDLDNLAIPEYVAGGDWEVYARGRGATIGSTFIENLNSCLGYDLTIICNGTQYESLEAYKANKNAADGYFWDYAKGNAALLTNIANLARYVLIHSGDKFFAAYIDIPTKQEYIDMQEQDLYAFVIRAIMNSSIDWMFIGNECTTLADVLYEAAAQFAWQDVPQCDFVKPVRADFASDRAYYDALLDGALDIMINIAVFNLNQTFDMVPAARKAGQSPTVNKDSGLLEYDKPWEEIAIQIATWGVHNYGKMLTSDGCTLDAIQLDANNNGTVGSATINTVWEDIDLIINSLIPISSTLSGANVWIHQDIAGAQNSDGGSDVIHSLLFDTLVGKILDLDATGLSTLLSRNTAGGTFTHDTIKAVLIQLVTNVLNLVFPGTITTSFASLDAVLQNGVLANMVDNILSKFYQYRDEWAVIALPVVCDALGLTDAQEFSELESYMPGTIDANAGSVSWQVFNGCSGLNTSSTNDNGVRIVDSLYTYVIDSVTTTGATGGNAATGLAAGAQLSGGNSATLTMAGPFTEGDVITVTIKYKVKVENGSYLQSGGADAVLACTSYAYVGSTAEDDSDFRTDKAIVKVNDAQYFVASNAASEYLNRGSGLGDADSYSVIVKAVGATDGQTAEITAVSGPAWLQKNSDVAGTKITMQGGNGNYSLVPFEVAPGYSRFSYEYKKAAVNADNFAELKNNLYVINDYRMYEKVAASATFDAAKAYYTYSDNTASGDTIINDGKYDATFTVAIKNGSTVVGSVTLPVSIILYNDYGMVSYTKNAITANRQSNDFSDADTEWNAYSAAIKNAAKLALAPKNCSNFVTKITTTNANYANNLYAEYYDALADAIEAIDEKKVTASVSDLQAAVEDVTGRSNSYYLFEGDTLIPTAGEKYGWNNVKYNATETQVNNGTSRYAYSYYGYRDFVPHTYQKFRDAKNDAESLINKVTFYPPVAPVLAPDANVYEYTKYQEELAAYNLALAQYNAKLENIPALNPVDVAYAYHMVTLTAGRLLYLDGDNSKLSYAVSKFGDVAAQGNYSQSTWDNYQTALTFANATLRNSSAKPSQINTALTELVYARKVLAEGADYTDLVAAINRYNDIDLSGYTDDTAAYFTAVLESAKDLVAQDISKSDSNQDRIDQKVADLTAAYNGLQAKAVDVEPQYALVQEDPGVFLDSFNFTDTYTPWIYDFTDYNSDMPFIAGLGVCWDPDVNCIIDPESCVNCYAVWDYNEGFEYGTGSIITIYNMHGTDDTSDDTVYAQYAALIFGDCTGDAYINGSDALYIDWYGIDQMMNPDYAYVMTAADIDFDWSASTTDSLLITFYEFGSAVITQDGEYPYEIW